MVELYTMQRYLQYEDLQKANLENFDNWASIFGETITAIDIVVLIAVRLKEQNQKSIYNIA